MSRHDENRQRIALSEKDFHKVRKIVWTKKSAMDYLARVNAGKLPHGLKALSAKDYLTYSAN